MCVCTHTHTCAVNCSVMSSSLRPDKTVARQAPLSMGFSRQEYWSGLTFPSSGDLLDPGIKPKSPESPALQVAPLLLSLKGSQTVSSVCLHCSFTPKRVSLIPLSISTLLILGCHRVWGRGIVCFIH